MSIEIQKGDDDKTRVLKIIGRFDFSIQREFRETYKNNNSAGIKYVVDLSQTEYIDSSALGMLLLLKEHAEENNGSTFLARPAEAIKKILTMANFDQLFKITE